MPGHKLDMLDLGAIDNTNIVSIYCQVKAIRIAESWFLAFMKVKARERPPLPQRLNVKLIRIGITGAKVAKKNGSPPAKLSRARGLILVTAADRAAHICDSETGRQRPEPPSRAAKIRMALLRTENQLIPA